MTDENAKSGDLESRLTEEQYKVTQMKGTERPFTGRYVDHKDDGTYSCVCCGASLFSSEHKYDSGSGWPSFWLPLAEAETATHTLVMYLKTGHNRLVCATALIPHRSDSTRASDTD
jgi:peptide-methionine (R)-S-oxide reductase